MAVKTGKSVSYAKMSHVRAANFWEGKGKL